MEKYTDSPVEGIAPILCLGTYRERGTVQQQNSLPHRIRGKGRLGPAWGLIIFYISGHEGISKTVVFEERSEESEGGSHKDIW